MEYLGKKIIHNYHLNSRNVKLSERDFLTQNSFGKNIGNYEDYKKIDNKEKKLLIVSKLLSSNDYFVKLSIKEIIENKDKKRKIILLVQANNNEESYFKYLKYCLDNIKIIFNCQDKKEMVEKAKYQLIKKVWNYKYGIVKTAYITKENVWDRFLQIYYLHEITTANDYRHSSSSWKTIKLGIDNYSIEGYFCEGQIKKDCQKCLACDINDITHWISEKKVECIKKIIECSFACQKCKQEIDYSSYHQLTKALNYKFWQWFRNNFKKNEWQISSIVIMKRYKNFILNYSSFLREFEILDERFFQNELLSIYYFILKLEAKSLKSKKSIISRKISMPSLRKENKEDFYIFPINYNVGNVVNIFLNFIGIQSNCKVYLGEGLNSLIIENYNKNLEELSLFIRESFDQRENTERIFLHFNHFKNKIDSFKNSRISIPNNVNWKEFCPEFEFSNYKFEPLSQIGSLQREFEQEFIDDNIAKLKEIENAFNKFEYFLFHLVKIFANEQIYKFINEKKENNFILMEINHIDYLAIEKILHLISKRSWTLINSNDHLLLNKKREETETFSIEKSINRINENILNYKVSIEKVSKIIEFIQIQYSKNFLEDNKKINLEDNNFVNSLVGIDGEEKIIEYYHFLLKKQEELESIPSYQELWDFFVKKKINNNDECNEIINIHTFNDTEIQSLQPWKEFVFDYEDYKEITEKLILEFSNSLY
jgi:hypothetical protein